jgi:hypothetical protein
MIGGGTVEEVKETFEERCSRLSLESMRNDTIESCKMRLMSQDDSKPKIESLWLIEVENGIDHYVRVDISGYVSYHVNNEMHREGNRPALIGINGAKEWYNNGRRYFPFIYISSLGHFDRIDELLCRSR